jgi:hypothetical protein
MRRIGVHGADQHGHPLADMVDRRLDEQCALVVAYGQKLARGPKDDQPRYPFGKLPVDEALPGSNVDAAAISRKRGDSNGETAAERLCH